MQVEDIEMNLDETLTPEEQMQMQIDENNLPLKPVIRPEFTALTAKEMAVIQTFSIINFDFSQILVIYTAKYLFHHIDLLLFATNG